MAVDIEAQTNTRHVNPEGASAQPLQKAVNGTPKMPRPRRPNYNEIHAKPLPLDVYPIPTFIPHNPISIVRIALSLLSHSLFPPKSHALVHRAYFSAQTQSIHVTDAASIRALWEQGFWGKGSLSRSEPQWLTGEKKKRGIEASKTSAEVTQNRREERKQFKLERARAQREAIEQQLRQEGKLDADGSIEEMVDDGKISESPRGTIYTPDAGDIVTVTGDSIVSEMNKSVSGSAPSFGEADTALAEEAEIKDQEHLQLTPEEAFYLTYTFGTLSVVPIGGPQNEDQLEVPYPAWYLFRLCAAYAEFPIPEAHISRLQSAYHLSTAVGGVVSDMPSIEPDNQFILRYVVYHHFRSLGWVVRPGIKFAVDYLLYLRGPAFHHAEFAIMIVPSYSDPYWTEAPESESNIGVRKKELGKKDWWWLHRVNRVQTAVFKTLVLAYVEVPPPWDGKSSLENGGKVDIGNVLKRYVVREVVVKRWSPNRNRD